MAVVEKYPVVILLAVAVITSGVSGIRHSRSMLQEGGGTGTGSSGEGDEAAPASALYTALSSAGILDTVLELVLDGNYTLFAPNDGAFRRAADAAGVTLPELLAFPNLADILEYHIVMNSTIASADLVDGQEVETLNGDTIMVSLLDDGSPVLNDQANIVVGDFPLMTGIVHVIDTVLLPEGINLTAIP